LLLTQLFLSTIGGFNFIKDDYFLVTNKIVDIADKYADGLVVSSLEGGYNTTALACSVAYHLLALLDK